MTTKLADPNLLAKSTWKITDALCGTEHTSPALLEAEPENESRCMLHHWLFAAGGAWRKHDLQAIHHTSRPLYELISPQPGIGLHLQPCAAISILRRDSIDKNNGFAFNHRRTHAPTQRRLLPDADQNRTMANHVCIILERCR